MMFRQTNCTANTITIPYTYQIPTLTHWCWQSWSEAVQTADYQRVVEARGCPRTFPPQRGVSWGTASRQKWGEQRQPFLSLEDWAGSDCPMKRNVVNGWAWVLCCCGSSTAGRSRQGPRGWPGGQRKPVDRGGYTVAGPAV